MLYQSICRQGWEKLHLFEYIPKWLIFLTCIADDFKFGMEKPIYLKWQVVTSDFLKISSLNVN